MPLNTRTPEASVTPASWPLAVFTGSEMAAGVVTTEAASAMATRPKATLVFIDLPRVTGDSGLRTRDSGLGIRDYSSAQSRIPDPQSPVPGPGSYLRLPAAAGAGRRLDERLQRRFRLLQPALDARRVDVVADRAVAFMAGVFPPFVAVIELDRELDRVWPHHDDRILDRHLVEHGVVVETREAFGRLHPLADRPAVAAGDSRWRAIHPEVRARRARLVVCGLDDERRPFPAAARLAHVVAVRGLQRRAAVGVDDAVLVDHLE